MGSNHIPDYNWWRIGLVCALLKAGLSSSSPKPAEALSSPQWFMPLGLKQNWTREAFKPGFHYDGKKADYKFGKNQNIFSCLLDYINSPFFPFMLGLSNVKMELWDRRECIAVAISICLCITFSNTCTGYLMHSNCQMEKSCDICLMNFIFDSELCASRSVTKFSATPVLSFLYLRVPRNYSYNILCRQKYC